MIARTAVPSSTWVLLCTLSFAIATFGFTVPVPAQDESRAGTIEVTVEAGVGSTRTFWLLVESTEATEGSSVGRLARSDGLLVATVDVDRASACDGAPLITGLTGATSCLRINEFPTHTTAKGDLVLGDGILSLTANAHHPLWIAGLAAAVASIFGAMAVWLMKTWLPGELAQRRRALAASQAEGAGLRGVQEWLAASAEYLEADEQTKKLKLAAATFQELQTEAREKLERSIFDFDASGTTTRHVPDIESARQALDVPTRMEDLYDRRGASATHRQSKLAARVSRINRIASQLDSADTWLAGAREGERKSDAQLVRVRLQGLFESISLETGADEVEDLSRLVQAELSSFIKLKAVDLRPPASFGGPSGSFAPARSTLVLGLGLVAVVAAIVIVFAALAVTLIGGNSSFGTVEDYAGVITTTAFGGGAATFVVALRDAFAGRGN